MCKAMASLLGQGQFVQSILDNTQVPRDLADLTWQYYNPTGRRMIFCDTPDQPSKRGIYYWEESLPAAVLLFEYRGKVTSLSMLHSSKDTTADGSGVMGDRIVIGAGKEVYIASFDGTNLEWLHINRLVPRRAVIAGDCMVWEINSNKRKSGRLCKYRPLVDSSLLGVCYAGSLPERMSTYKHMIYYYEDLNIQHSDVWGWQLMKHLCVLDTKTMVVSKVAEVCWNVVGRYLHLFACAAGVYCFNELADGFYFYSHGDEKASGLVKIPKLDALEIPDTAAMSCSFCVFDDLFIKVRKNLLERDDDGKLYRWSHRNQSWSVQDDGPNAWHRLPYSHGVHLCF